MKKAFPVLLGLMLLGGPEMDHAQSASLNPVLAVTPMSCLVFSNLPDGGVCQLQQLVAWYWTNLPVNFTATNSNFTQMVPGAFGEGDYRLALGQVPAQAFAVAQVANGLLTGSTVTSGGSGYLTNPGVVVFGGGGSNAAVVAGVSGGEVTTISIASPGEGYTNAPTFEIASPPADALYPAVLPVIRLDSTNLISGDAYQIQFTPVIADTWQNWTNGLLSSTDGTNSQFLSGFAPHGK